MGRSYLSIKLAVLFGLLVAAAVSTQEQALRSGPAAAHAAEHDSLEPPVVEMTRPAPQLRRAPDAPAPADDPCTESPRAEAIDRACAAGDGNG